MLLFSSISRNIFIPPGTQILVVDPRHDITCPNLEVMSIPCDKQATFKNTYLRVCFTKNNGGKRLLKEDREFLFCSKLFNKY